MLQSVKIHVRLPWQKWDLNPGLSDFKVHALKQEFSAVLKLKYA